MLTSMKRYLLIGLGYISLGLGIIGILIPVLPTTPFLLLSSFCFVRSSDRLYQWLMNHKVLGAYIQSYVLYKAIGKKTRMITLIFLWGTLTTSMILVRNIHVTIFLIAVGIGVSIHLIKLKALEEIDFADGMIAQKVVKQDAR